MNSRTGAAEVLEPSELFDWEDARPVMIEVAMATHEYDNEKLARAIVEGLRKHLGATRSVVMGARVHRAHVERTREGMR